MTSLPPLEPNYATALRLIDEAHAEDPRPGPSTNPDDDNDGKPVPFELDYARKMTRWLAVREPNASPALQLACRAQHFRRWEHPRTTHPPTRAGYLTWRAKQKTLAATQLLNLLTTSPAIQPPLPAAVTAHIAALVRKEGLSPSSSSSNTTTTANDTITTTTTPTNTTTNEKKNGEAQILEDVACLVFLDDQLEGFERASGVEEGKLVRILQKTWGKMSGRGREIALGMELGERARVLVGKALAGEE